MNYSKQIGQVLAEEIVNLINEGLKRMPTPKDLATVADQWSSGDYVYGAVSAIGGKPIYAFVTLPNSHGPVWHKLVKGREFPVAQLGSAGLDAHGNRQYIVMSWVHRTERFPEPIKGFNY